MPLTTRMDGARKKIYSFPHPVLREVSKPVDLMDPGLMKRVREIVPMLRELMHSAAGWGLSAIQVGIPLRIFVAHVPRETPHPIVFVNPEIIGWAVDYSFLREGCLSFGSETELVKRSITVLVRRWNEHGQMDVFNFKGDTARVVQHEMDHLNGVLLIDHIESAFARKKIEEKLRRKHSKQEAKAPVTTTTDDDKRVA